MPFLADLVRQEGGLSRPQSLRAEWRELERRHGRGARGLFRRAGLPPDIMAAQLGLPDDSALLDALTAELDGRDHRRAAHADRMDQDQEAHAARLEAQARAAACIAVHPTLDGYAATLGGAVVAEAADGLALLAVLINLGFAPEVTA